MSEYADASYWNDRYTKDEKTFEWSLYTSLQTVPQN